MVVVGVARKIYGMGVRGTMRKHVCEGRRVVRGIAAKNPLAFNSPRRPFATRSAFAFSGGK